MLTPITKSHPQLQRPQGPSLSPHGKLSQCPGEGKTSSSPWQGSSSHCMYHDHEHQLIQLVVSLSLVFDCKFYTLFFLQLGTEPETQWTSSLMILVGSCGHHDKIPQTGGLQMTEVCCLNSGGWKSEIRSWQDHVLSDGSRGELSLASSSFRHLPSLSELYSFQMHGCSHRVHFPHVVTF